MYVLHNYFKMQIVFFFFFNKGTRRIVVITVRMNNKKKKLKHLSLHYFQNHDKKEISNVLKNVTKNVIS